MTDRENPVEALGPCTVGIADGTVCHLKTYCRKSSLKSVAKLSADERKLVIHRSGIPQMQNEQSEICLHHEALLLTKYEFLQKECSNPFQEHGSGIKGSLQRIDLATADSLTELTSKTFHPGQKLCPNCRAKLAKMQKFICIIRI